ncbi:MAG: BlaI/MecI/CopY family transcriptional regulator [Myxococcota bacterium]|nr:BlaI/MecI/CopY family transcriptional regulator [Myxococcota bacterium]
MIEGLGLADTSRADVEAFAFGDSSTLAGGLEAFARSCGALAWVVVPRAARARRVIAPAHRLFDAHELATPRPGRTELGLSVLALAPLGLDLSTFFLRVYGFAFRRSVHDGVVRVLMTRMRKVLEPYGEIARSGERLTLVAHETLAIPDPRVATPIESAVSRAVAEGGGVSAKELADKLDLPLRTVQAELARLVEDGVCVRRSQGRATEYVVEDTALLQPTRFLRG